MKVIGTTVCLTNMHLKPLKELGHNKATVEFRLICGCKSRADANRQCEALGMRHNTFHPACSSFTGNEEELRVAGEGGVFLKYSTADGAKWISVAELISLGSTD